MITVRYCPKLLSADGQIVKQIQFVEGKPADYYANQAGVDLSGCKIITAELSSGGEIMIVPDIQFDPVTFGTFWAFVLNTIAAVVISTAVNYGINLLFARKPSRNTVGSGIDDGSPTYGWEGILTRQEIGTPVGIVYGEHLVGGNIINQFLSEDGDKHYLNSLIAISEGEIESIEEVYVNGNPIENYDAIDYDERMGTNAQTPIANFNDLHDINSVDVNLTKNNPHTYAGKSSVMEGFDVNFVFPNGVYVGNNDGSVSPWSVQVKIQWKLHSDEDYTNHEDITFTLKSRTTAHRKFSVRGLTAGKYDVKITRLSNDSTIESPIHIGDLTWMSLDEVATGDLAYPNTALIGIKALATDQLHGNTPNFGIVVKGKKIKAPDITYEGSPVAWEDYYHDGTNYRRFSDTAICDWNGETMRDEWCANPVWCLYDFLLNSRYGLGDFIDTAMIDFQSFKYMSQYCENAIDDGNEGKEKRFRLNIVLDSKTKALDAVVQLAQSFRGLVLYSQGTIKVKIDKQDAPVQLFGVGNIVRDSFTESWSSIKEKFNIVEVQYLDKDKLYAQEQIAVIDDEAISGGEIPRKQQLRVFTTSQRQAYREARYLLYRNKYINRTISFRAGIDSIICEAGDVINVSHDTPQWGYSGRALTHGWNPFTGRGTITLEQEIDIESGKTYKILMRSGSDIISERPVMNSPGKTNVITYDAQEVFYNTPNAREIIYAIGEVGKSAKPFRIQEIKIANDHEATITAVEYKEDIYDDTAPPNPENNYSALDFETPDVKNLALSEAFGVSEDGTVFNGIDVWFEKPDATDTAVMFSRARIYLSSDGGHTWDYIGETYGNSYQIRGTLETGVQYRVAVVSVNVTGKANVISASPYADITLTGKAPAPANVQGFSYSWGSVLLLAWNDNVEADLAGYEIRDEDNHWGVDDEHLIYRGLTNRKTLNPDIRSVGTLYIKAFNTTGSYSLTAGQVSPTVSAPSAPSDLSADVLYNIARLYWIDTGGSNIRHYEVFRSQTDEWSGEEVMVGKASGKSIEVMSRQMTCGIAEDGDEGNLIDSSLSGFGDDYFVGCTLLITEGANAGQSVVITGFDDETGTLLFDELDEPIDNSSRYIISDNGYYRVRGVDQYGAGAFSVSHKVEYQPMDDRMFGDNIITARKIYVAELSALSANLGCITAGTITGATFQTASGGARTIMDNNGIRSYNSDCCKLVDISNGNFCLLSAVAGERLELIPAGLYGYDCEDKINLKICSGHIQATDAKFVDPACECVYSYLSSGRLRFKDEFGDVPYLTRICSGYACTGEKVVLQGWVAPPNIIVGIRHLQSFNSGQPTTCQTWSIYNSEPICYCNCETDYGYCFTVHACLMTTGSVAAECVRNLSFGQCFLTENCVCSTCIVLQFMAWCNPACQNYCAGCICYDVCYRKNGSGTWCKCSFAYTQPHSNTVELKSIQCVVKNVDFGDCGCWQVMTCEKGTSWIDTGIPTATYITCLCIRPFGGSITTYGCLTAGGGGGNPPVIGILCRNQTTWNGETPPNLYCSYICYCWQTLSSLFGSGNTWCGATAYSSGFVRILIGGNQVAYCSINTNIANPYCVIISATGGIYGFGASDPSISPIYLDYCGYGSGDSLHIARACVCMRLNCAILYQCWCCITGTAGYGKTACIHSSQDTFGTICVLDPSGCLNWLAIAY